MKYLSVKQFNQYIKTSFKHDPLFQNVNIEGEVCNFKISHNHIYFSLKEDDDIIDCAIYNYEIKEDFDFDNGDSVILSGNIIYNNYISKITLAVNYIKKQGISKDYLEFLRLREFFYKEGYFDKKRKKEITPYPQKVGLVTSDKSAAIVDFLSVMNKEIQNIEIYLYSVKVQGKLAKDEIINALDKLDELGLDCIVITRGGGSNLDLNVFNDKDIVEKIYRLKTATLSAIGHKIDFCLTDLVSDISVQTPTEAGTYIVRNYSTLRKDFEIKYKQIIQIVLAKIEKKDLELKKIKAYLNLYRPLNLIELKENKLENIYEKFKSTMDNSIRRKEDYLNNINLRLKSSRDILEIKKNSIFIKDINDKYIYSKNSVKDKDKLKIVFSDGEIKVEVCNE